MHSTQNHRLTGTLAVSDFCVLDIVSFVCELQSCAPRPRRPFQARWHPPNSFHHVRRFELQRTAPGSPAPPAPARAGERRRFHSCVSLWARAPSLNSAGPEGGSPWRRRRPLEVRAGQGPDGLWSSRCVVDRDLPVHFPGLGIESCVASLWECSGFPQG